MKTQIILFFLNILSFHLQAQQTVSGFLNLDQNADKITEVSLFEVSAPSHMEVDSGHFIANAPINEAGFFAFDRNLFDSTNRIYKIQVNGIANSFKNNCDPKAFILSNKDNLSFKKGNCFTDEYTNTNTFDKRWLRLRHMEEQYLLHPNQDNQIRYRDFTRDSLEILLVKLISIKKLNDKNLLETDIKANQEYYIALLDQFKASNLDPIEYAYLESKCALVAKDLIHRKYKISMALNAIAFLLIATLTFFLFKFRNKPHQLPIANLSKQENTIKNLILEGKTNKEIANELFVSISTVKTHITNIYNKLGVSNRKELIASQ